MNKTIRVIDLEIGSDSDEAGPGICEYGHCDVISTQADMLGAPYGWEVSGSKFEALIDPKKPIEVRYSAIHNITDEDIDGKPEWHKIAPLVAQAPAGMEIVAFAAHNKKMESHLIHERITGYLPWICTYKVALKLWPDAPSHSNNALRYYINPPGLVRASAVPTHRAFPDAYVTAFTLREALNMGHTFETLVKWSDEPAMQPRCKIGKYRTDDGKGTPWKDVDTSYMEWILDKDFDEDTKHTCRVLLHERMEQQNIDRQQADLNRQFVANGMAPAALSRPGQLATEDAPANRELPL